RPARFAPCSVALQTWSPLGRLLQNSELSCYNRSYRNCSARDALCGPATWGLLGRVLAGPDVPKGLTSAREGISDEPGRAESQGSENRDRPHALGSKGSQGDRVLQG